MPSLNQTISLIFNLFLYYYLKKMIFLQCISASTIVSQFQQDTFFRTVSNLFLCSFSLTIAFKIFGALLPQSFEN